MHRRSKMVTVPLSWFFHLISIVDTNNFGSKFCLIASLPLRLFLAFSFFFTIPCFNSHNSPSTAIILAFSFFLQFHVLFS